MKYATIAVAAVLLSTVFLTALPAASAHTCKAYDGCDAGACKDGEDHDHTDMNYWPKRDEHCESHAKPPPPPCVPAILCGAQAIIERTLGPIAIAWMSVF